MTNEHQEQDAFVREAERQRRLLEDWKLEVANGDTYLGLLDWVEQQMEWEEMDAEATRKAREALGFPEEEADCPV